MVRLVADPLYEYLISAFPATRPYSRQSLQRSQMPPLVARFIDRALDQQLEAEEGRLSAARTTWFDYRHSDVERAYRTLLETLGRHAQIPAAEWPRVLRNAIDQVTSYLIHPTRTLPDFIFSDSDGVMPASVILLRMGHFGAYRYLEDAVSTYVEQKNARELDRARFTSIIAHVDRQMTEEHDADDWLRLLEPLFDLARVVPSLSRGLPLPLLRGFFAAKRDGVVERRLAFVAEKHGVEALDDDGLRELLEAPEERFASAVSPREEAPSLATPPLPLWKRFQHGSHEEQVLARDPAPPPDERPTSSPVPLWKKFRVPADEAHGPPPDARGSSRDVRGQSGDFRGSSSDVRDQFQDARRPATEGPATAQRGRGPAPEYGGQAHEGRVAPSEGRAPAQEGRAPAQEGRAVEIRVQPERAAEAPTGLPALERAVLGERGFRNRNLFVRHLFHGSSDAYEASLRRLERASSWAQASQIIAEEIFLKNQINIYSEPAIAFTDAVEARYKA